MENKIKWVSEAYHKDGLQWNVTPERLLNEEIERLSKNSSIKEIKLEQATNIGGDLTPVYRAYNYNGELLYQWLADSVNIGYFTNEMQKDYERKEL